VKSNTVFCVYSTHDLYSIGGRLSNKSFVYVLDENKHIEIGTGGWERVHLIFGSGKLIKIEYNVSSAFTIIKSQLDKYKHVT
jgi:hypothetical protein